MNRKTQFESDGWPWNLEMTAVLISIQIILASKFLSLDLTDRKLRVSFMSVPSDGRFKRWSDFHRFVIDQ